MCMLTYLPEGIQPDPQALRHGAEYNRDGHGFAVVAGSRLIIRHGMNAEQMIDAFAKQRRKHAGGPALFHSRFGTGGSLDSVNCHPFRIGGDRRSVIAHNGVLPASVQPGTGERRCDTRITADDLMRGEDLGSPDYQSVLAHWMGPRNKFVILTVNPRYTQRSWIINEDSGLWHHGVWYSNHDFEGRYRRYLVGGWNTTSNGASEAEYAAASDAEYAAWWRERDIDSETCQFCAAKGAVNLDTGTCDYCLACQDCGAEDTDCLCYLPATPRRTARTQ